MKVLIRLDDFTPNRNLRRWEQIEKILDIIGVKPLVACIPDDKYFGSVPSSAEFWEQIRNLERKGWTIALHGETHLVAPIAPKTSHEIFFADKSEFIGLPEDVQLQKIERAWNIFAEHGVRPSVFVAPNHGFDANTIRALCKHGAMPFVSDGISWRVFRDRGLTWLPQLDWRMPRLRFGFRTVCLHPSTMGDREMDTFENASRAARHCFISINEIDQHEIGNHGIADVLFKLAFAVYLNAKKALYRWNPLAQSKKKPTSESSHG
jgi:hypothetical protein